MHRYSIYRKTKHHESHEKIVITARPYSTAAYFEMRSNYVLGSISRITKLLNIDGSDEQPEREWMKECSWCTWQRLIRAENIIVLILMVLSESEVHIFTSGWDPDPVDFADTFFQGIRILLVTTDIFYILYAYLYNMYIYVTVLYFMPT